MYLAPPNAAPNQRHLWRLLVLPLIWAWIPPDKMRVTASSTAVMSRVAAHEAPSDEFSAAISDSPPLLPSKGAQLSRLPVLDGVRGTAILLVIVGHCLWSTRWHAVGLPIGYSGVSIFFVLSGYLITRVLLADEESSGRVRLLRFYQRRAMRIFPALYFFLAILAVLTYFRLFPAIPSATWLASVFYASNLVPGGWETGHLWSLALEEQFYLFWPAIFAVTPRHLRMKMVLAFVVAFTIWRIHVVPSLHGGLYIRPDLRMDTFLIGGAFAIADRTFICARSAPFFIGALAVWSIVGPGCFPAIDTCVSAAIIGAVVTWLAKSPADGAAVWLSKPGPVAVGAISYSLYLWQQLFLGPHLRWWSLPAVLLVACASYFAIERPVVRLRSALA